MGTASPTEAVEVLPAPLEHKQSDIQSIQIAAMLLAFWTLAIMVGVKLYSLGVERSCLRPNQVHDDEEVSQGSAEQDEEGGERNVNMSVGAFSPTGRQRVAPSDSYRHAPAARS